MCASDDMMIEFPLCPRCRRYEGLIAPVKDRLFSQLFQGLSSSSPQHPLRILEVGFGTGPNLGYYSRIGPQQIEVGGIIFPF